jgi:hypothetical protein
MCRPDDEPLIVRVLRGTTALHDHEVALTELCANPDTTSTETDQCLIDYIQGGYATLDNNNLGDYQDDTDTDANSNTAANGRRSNIIDDTSLGNVDGECLLNDLHSLWASDAVIVPTTTTATATSLTTDVSNPKADTVKPWSSRASPSGTFVRDPTTGKMTNLDATK